MILHVVLVCVIVIMIGAIQISDLNDGDVNISENDFRRNTAVEIGGAVRLFNFTGTETTVTNNAFVRNVSREARGGAVFTDSIIDGSLNTEGNSPLTKNLPDDIVNEE